MKYRSVFFTFFLLILLNNFVYGQSTIDLLRKGNAKYKERKYQQAEENFRKAIEKDNKELRAIYNLGNSLYKQEKYNEAQQKYFEIINTSKDNKEKARAFYNLGNTLLKERKYKESLEYFKKSLKLNPNDFDAKYNYEYAKKMLLVEQSNQKQKQNNQKQEQNNQEKNTEKDNKQNQKEQEKNQQMSDRNQQKLSQQNIQNILNALRNEEKKTQKEVKAKLLPRVEKKIEKNW